jgi:hypothetical protein
VKRFAIIFFVFCSATVYAGEITSLDNAGISLTSFSTPDSTFRPLQFCNQGHCELIPQKDVLLQQAFSEKDLNWQQIFKQCKNYSSLNQLTNWTQIVSSLVVALKPITTLRKLRSTKNLLASWGVIGKVVGQRIVFEAGVTIAGQVVYSIPRELLDTGEPYPELAPEDVELVSNLIEEVLSEGSEVYFLPVPLIEGIAVILKGCTSQLKHEYTTNQAQSCLAGCHSTKKTKSSVHTLVPPTPAYNNAPLTLEIQKHQLEDYLQ